MDVGATKAGDPAPTKVRLGALMFGLMGLLGVLAPLAPHRGHYDTTLILAPSLASIVISGAVWSWRRAVPDWLFLPLLVVGFVFDGMGLVGAHATATTALVMLPAVLWGSYYLPRRRDLLTGLVAMCLSYGVALSVDRPSGIVLSGQWITSMTYLALAAWVTHISSTRLNTLLSESREESLVDALTDLSNRRRLLHDLAALSNGERHLLVLFDLNGFKAYNDSFGHLAGDELLRDLARRLGAAVVGAGRAYRLGGDEFCAILRGNEEETTATLIAATDAFSCTGPDYRIDAAWGAARIPDEASTSEDVLGLADERMYACKHRQRTIAPLVRVTTAQ